MRRQVAISFILLLLCALPASAGMYYEATTTVDNGQGSNQVKGWVDGEKSRVEFVASEMPQVGAGSYLVTEDGGRTLFLVDPQEKTYSRYDLAAMMSVLESTGGLFEMQFSDPEVEVLDESDGGSLLGHSTRYVKTRTRYDMTMKVMGMTRVMKTDSVQEMWLAQGLDQPGFFAWLRKGLRTTGDSGLDKVLSAEMDKVEGGVPLKSVVVSTTANQKGRGTETRTVTEVTRIEETSIDGKIFRVPAEFTEVDLLSGAANDNEGGNPLRGLFGGG
ncbi:MAG: DUF4412 domain-containing protein [Acidobacteriota bacterium]